MASAFSEILKIENFLSISFIEWKIQRLNVIIGDMASGKSLCMKLLKFFEDIIPKLLESSYDCFCKNLKKENYFRYLAENFNKAFDFSVSDPSKQKQFTITYTFSCNEKKFDMIIEGSNEKNIVVKSSYIENLLQKWSELLQKDEKLSPDKPEDVKDDSLQEFKYNLYNDILKNFDGYFPVSTAFIPASRAALFVSSNYSDYYLRKYNEKLGILLNKPAKNDIIINDILKAKIKMDKDKNIFLESNDSRRVSIDKASSGQQEIVFVLMHLDRLGNNGYTYAKTQSLFIEEPSAYLSPQDEKQLIEFIVGIYNRQKDTEIPIRFFITTYSLYIIDSLNNMLKKGALIKKYENQINKINSRMNIPPLYADDVSAYYINNNGLGRNIFIKKKNCIQAREITKVSDSIRKDVDKLFKLEDELSKLP